MPLGLKESETDALDQAAEDGDFEVMLASTDGVFEEKAYSTRGVVGNSAPFVRRFEQKVKKRVVGNNAPFVRRFEQKVKKQRSKKPQKRARRRSSLGAAAMSAERSTGALVATLLPYGLACAILFTVFKAASIRDVLRERKERRTSEGRAERVALMA